MHPESQPYRGRIRWADVLDAARPIVESYDTGVTLRQLFYRLVAALLLPNTLGAYKRLSAATATARRAGTFPDLLDTTRVIHEPLAFENPWHALEWLEAIYRHDRAGEQDTSLYLAVEKRGIVEQLRAWFGDELGIPVLALGGYSSQTYVDEVRARVLADDRRAVLIYAGDFDPSGEDIDRDFIERADCFDEVHRVALNAEQVRAYNLPEQPGKATDSRAAGFAARHGRLVQVELDALDPNVLRGLYADAIAAYWDTSRFERTTAREAEQRARLLDAELPDA